MKKFLLMSVIALVAVTASAQVEKGFRMGVQLNGGISNVCGDGTHAAFGYGAGWIAEYNFNSNLYLQSGIGLQDISTKLDGIDGTLNAFFGQLPVHIGYRFNVGDNLALFVQAGPTFGVGLFGSKIEFDNGESTNYFDFAKRFDLGVGGRLGVEFSHIQISVGANYGVLKAFDNGSYHNLSANLGVAYMF